MTSKDIEEVLQNEFGVEREWLFLNHAAVAPWPKRTADVIKDFAEECFSAGAAHYLRWLDTEQELRHKLAQLFNAPSINDIGLLKNTSEALSVVAHGFPWRPGDNVIISDEEFPSNRIVWESLQQRGVEVKQISLAADMDVEAVLVNASDSRTRLVSISSVEYASGLRIDLKRLGKLCHERGIAFCVDAIQGLGAIEHDVQNMHIDFLMADGHKWLLAPEGIAVFYCSEAWRDRLALHQYGWHMVEDCFDFDKRTWQPARSARRFECGSSNMLGIHALNASLSLLLELGIPQIEQRILDRSKFLFKAIQESTHLELITSSIPGRYAGIVTFKHRTAEADRVFEHLKARNVICAGRGGGIRFSPHCYTSFETLHDAVGFADI